MGRADHWPSNNVATSEHSRLRTHLTQVLHGSEQATKEEKYVQVHIHNRQQQQQREALIERILRCNPYKVRMFEASCRALHPVIDRAQSPDRVSKHNVPYLASADRRTAFIRDRVFEAFVPHLASTDHQNPIIDNPFAQSPRSVLYPLIEITQATNRLFHASCPTNIRTSSSCNIDHGTVG